MALAFYPHTEDAQKGSLAERIETLMEAAERYKAIILDSASKSTDEKANSARRLTPRDLIAAYNWEEIARLLREIRELPESNKSDKLTKATLIMKLSEVYEVLRAAKMPKLEAVRLALNTEANQLRGGGSQVA